jgi:uncharacterized protein YqjF (DUF2071 family)
MTFLHWAYDPEQLRPLLHDGLEPDLFDGRAWVSLTPFLMADFRVGFLPAVRGLSTFPETNLRTYVRGPDGRDGLWFLSLEADSLPTVVAASVGYGVPYRWAEMSVDEGPPVRYRSRRRVGPRVGHDITVRPGPPRQAPSALEHWLTGRWRAWTVVGRRLATVPVRHEPWPLCDASVEHLQESLRAAAGLPETDGPPLLQWSPGVDDVRLGLPHPL